MSIDLKIPGYELIEEIGAGGMAKVYLGMQILLERKVAIKILHQRLSAESEEFKQRFFTEGRVLAKLQHDNIVSIIDIGEAEGMLYMAMEYVENGTLTDWLKKPGTHGRSGHSDLFQGRSCLARGPHEAHRAPGFKTVQYPVA